MSRGQDTARGTLVGDGRGPGGVMSVTCTWLSAAAQDVIPEFTPNQVGSAVGTSVVVKFGRPWALSQGKLGHKTRVNQTNCGARRFRSHAFCELQQKRLWGMEVVVLHEYGRQIGQEPAPWH
jgi:hypothetical protein